MLENSSTIRKLKATLHRTDEIRNVGEYSSDFGVILYCAEEAAENPLMFIPLGIGIAKALYDTNRMSKGKKPVLATLVEYADKKFQKRFHKTLF